MIFSALAVLAGFGGTLLASKATTVVAARVRKARVLRMPINAAADAARGQTPDATPAGTPLQMFRGVADDAIRKTRDPTTGHVTIQADGEGSGGGWRDSPLYTDQSAEVRRPPLAFSGLPRPLVGATGMDARTEFPAAWGIQTAAAVARANDFDGILFDAQGLPAGAIAADGTTVANTPPILSQQDSEAS